MWGNGGMAPRILNLGEGLASRTGRFILGTHWIEGWVGTRVGLDAVTKKIPVPTGILTLVVQPVV
jgi:hypothetical protein